MSERSRSLRPDDASWRADAMAGSRHSRLVDELVMPLENHDVDAAARVCGEVCRQLLSDFAPALLLLPTTMRRRAQALTSYGLTLFDFARQSGLEGERLAAVNRWEFELEEALGGQPAGQPVFLMIWESEQQLAWPRKGFDELHRLARRRCAVRRPDSIPAMARDATQLSAAAALLLQGDPPSPALVELGAAAVRLRWIVDLGEDIRRHRIHLPASQIPDTWDADTADMKARIDTAVGAECAHITQMLQGVRRKELPRKLRPACRYVLSTARDLCRRSASLGSEIVDRPPSLGVGRRLMLLARARWLT